MLNQEDEDDLRIRRCSSDTLQKKEKIIEEVIFERPTVEARQRYESSD